VAVYFALQSPTVWNTHRYQWLKIALHLGFSDCELSWSKNGQEQRTPLRGEQVCFIGPEEMHGLHWRTQTPMVWIFVDHDYLEQIGFQHIQGVTCTELVKLVRHDLGIFRLSRLFYEACFEKSKPVPLYIEAKGTLLATRLLRAQFTPIASTEAREGISTPALQRVFDYIHSKISVPESRSRHLPAPAPREELSNAVLARIAGQSEFHFIRQFKERMKTTPQDYVMQCRLDKAEELIVAQHYSPKEAAYAAGFCEPGHLYKRFRQRYGKSPHDLRKQ